MEEHFAQQMLRARRHQCVPAAVSLRALGRSAACQPVQHASVYECPLRTFCCARSQLRDILQPIQFLLQ